MIIGFGYKARAGKDTAGMWIQSKWDLQRTAFAENLKNAVKEIYGWTDDHVYGHLKEVVCPFWGVTPREVMQRFGTEACRDVLRQDIWIKSLERKVTTPQTYPGWPTASYGQGWVITDVRYPNEADAIHRWGGKVIQIIRDNRDSISGEPHRSELSMNDYKDWDFTVYNNGTFEEFYAELDQMIRHFKGFEVL
jgi:hypothetical protein